MVRTLVTDLEGHLGQVVRVCGWAETGAAAERLITDHTGTVTVVGGDQMEVTDGSAVEAVGEVITSPGRGTVAPSGPHRAGRGTVELDVVHLRVLGSSQAAPPLDERSSLEERLDWRYLDLRRPGARLGLVVQTTLERAMREGWDAHGFVEIHSPKLLPTGPRPEELFALGYFDRQAWLAQSPQFYKQMAMAAGLDRVFEVGPVFRAEPRLSSRHATEFTSVDVEMAWIESHEEVMAFAEQWLSHAVGQVSRCHGTEIGERFGVKITVPRTPFPRVTLAQAWELALQNGHPGGDESTDLDPEAERLVSRHMVEQQDHEMVWVTGYPEKLRPFYHMVEDDGSGLSKSFDLLWNGIEVASGAQREHRHDRLLAQARSRDLPLGPIRYFLDFFRFGCPPHGGFGFGLNRLMMCLLGQHDVREVTYLPRDRDRLSP